jgi:hypothetical protein
VRAWVSTIAMRTMSVHPISYDRAPGRAEN